MSDEPDEDIPLSSDEEYYDELECEICGKLEDECECTDTEEKDHVSD
jgi:hypothetical protein